ESARAARSAWARTRRRRRRRGAAARSSFRDLLLAALLAQLRRGLEQLLRLVGRRDRERVVHVALDRVADRRQLAADLDQAYPADRALQAVVDAVVARNEPVVERVQHGPALLLGPAVGVE